MKIKLIFLLLIFLSDAAVAQDKPQWEVFGGFQYTRLGTGVAQASLNSATQLLGVQPLPLGSHLSLSGWNASLQENKTSWLGGVVDFSGSYVTKSLLVLQVPGTTDTLRNRIRFYTFMAGPQVTMRRSGRLQPFARALVGGARLKVEDIGLTNGVPATTTLAGGETNFAVGGGGGVDLHVVPHVALRAVGDYIRPYLGGMSEGHFRVSGGLTYRIGTK
jgi:opacity protein-like surface antigen